jgi:hypothetical protein
MAKKAKGTKNHPAEILDDNGTLIAASNAPGAKARGNSEGEASTVSEERGVPKKPS